MRIATWNINSVRARFERALDVLERHNLDALALQEIKCKPEQFPLEPFEQAGYQVACHGLNQWNGVAIISRVGLADVEVNFPGQPTFKDTVEARALGATVGSGDQAVRLWSLYVPNGRSLEDPHYEYKLEWLSALRDYQRTQLEANPQAQIALVGDWNVAPQDHDVFDPQTWDGLYVSDRERQAFNAFSEVGFTELTRPRVDGYTFWDYQRLRFPRNEGMRIDWVYASPALEARATAASIDRDERKGKGASDHVPVIVDFK